MNDNEKLYLGKGKSLYTAIGTVAALSSFTVLAQIANSKIDFGNESRLFYEQMQKQDISSSPYIADSQRDIANFEKLISFAKKFIESQVDLDAEFQKILNDNFWDFV